MLNAPQGSYEFLDGADAAYAHQKWLAINGDLLWIVNNSGIDDYSKRSRLLGRDDGLIDIINTYVTELEPGEENIGLDIAAGSTARALRDLIHSGVLHRALATNYDDLRTEDIRSDRRLSHIKGGLTDPATWRKMEVWKRLFAPNGFAIAMHRPVGGLQELPPRTYYGAAHFILDMVRPGGIMFTQIPRSMVKYDRLALNALCGSIRRRDDVAGVVVSPPASLVADTDWADMYAVILKKRNNRSH